ncbi:hypothetical protein [Raineyella fluvialis]|uniref:Polyketide cyclase / dehydrase and lipid transport n=1 Tax=Raineyella fluvialis TaxID=2662261 RepID=A0A5Q2FDC3_9ACTN|nr:hypothetical protein [Raineyella fluvialis]QGF24371.1 hypothetical protein Rai3103_12660 [Raineyella fluvialis]
MMTRGGEVAFDLETAAAPEKMRAALIDFSDDRTGLWPGIEPSLYEVVAVGDTTADVREGSRGPGGNVWALEHYDWSDPVTVRWTVRESNFCRPGSYVSAAIRPTPGGGSSVHITWNRTGSTVRGRLMCWMIRLSGGRPVAASFRRGLAAIERA